MLRFLSDKKLYVALGFVLLILFLASAPRTAVQTSAAMNERDVIPVISATDMCVFVSDAGNLSQQAPQTPHLVSRVSLTAVESDLFTDLLPGESHLAWLQAAGRLHDCRVLVEVIK